jgi:hypothetical protein
MIRSIQHRHNLDTGANESLHVQKTKPAHEFESWLRRRDGDDQDSKAEAEISPEAAAIAHASAPDLHGVCQDEPAHAGVLDTPTPATAAAAQAHLRMALPLAPQTQTWTFDLSSANLPVQSLTLSRVSNGQLNLSIQSSSHQAGQNMETLLPKLKQRLADKVASVAMQAGEHVEAINDVDDGSVAT